MKKSEQKTGSISPDLYSCLGTEMGAQYEKQENRTLLAKELAKEGMVLLKNEGNLLPLSSSIEVAVFGRAQLDTLIGGSGSGASSSKDATIIVEELKKVGLQPVEKLELFYRNEADKLKKSEKDVEEARAEFEGLLSSGMIYEIFGRYTPPVEEFPIHPSLLEGVDKETTAICVLSRSSGGEECDRRVEEDYYLTKSEKELVDLVGTYFKKVVLVLNINGFIDLSWTANYSSIQGILYMGTAGEQGAAALSELLVGKDTPSGKLSATIAYSYMDYPSSPYFMTNKEEPDTIPTYEDYGLSAEENGSVGFKKSPVAFYQEGIYVGYRYFDTFKKEVLYPFGYGLSYTDFVMEYISSHIEEKNMILSIKVTNKGNEYSGKEVVQLYVKGPKGRVERPYQELITYEKTKRLAPNESEVIQLTVPLHELAVYEENTASYVIEAGDYHICIGNSSKNNSSVGVVRVSKDVITAKYKNRLGLKEVNREKLEFLRQQSECVDNNLNSEDVVLCSLDETFASLYKNVEEKSENSAKDIAGESQVLSGSDVTPNEISFNDRKYSLLDVKNGNISMEEFVQQLSVEELAVLVNGYGPGLPFGGIGSNQPPTIYYENGEAIATSTHPKGFPGYISPALTKYGIPSVFYKDGPAGVAMVAWPTGMSMACTFNKELLYEFGHACGTEAELQHVDSWLAPAVNIQRSPIGGRNFEYYSEDPRHTGYCGLAIALGAEENNKVTTCPKHFAINEQETYRRGNIKRSYDALDSIIEERAAREIYLKPFEMIVRGSKVSTFMSSFNKINGTFAAGNSDLCNAILREEWGYNGIVVTDWGDMDIVVDGADAVAAGNDIIMPGGPPVIKQVLDGYKEGRCTLEDLRTATINLLTFVMNSASFEYYCNNQ